MPTLWIFDIEPHEQRYTVEWRTHLPHQLRHAIQKNAKKDWLLQVISGAQTPKKPTPGAFLNFAETNIYKSNQVSQFAEYVRSGHVRPNDRVLFADAWHPGVINVRYMSDLLDLKLSIRVMWHAGSYDAWDILGRGIRDKRWSYNFERAIFSAAGRNYFATKYHQNLFFEKIHPRDKEKSSIVGWPMEYLQTVLGRNVEPVRKDTILFPHRISAEKQPDIMKMLEPLLPEYRVCFAQENQLTKQQYHEELARSVAVFSASQQETLGIGVFEGLLCGAVPIVPHRLSYPEIYPTLSYPSDWTTSLEAAQANSAKLTEYIRKQIADHNVHSLAGRAQWASKFFNGGKLYASVLR